MKFFFLISIFLVTSFAKADLVASDKVEVYKRKGIHLLQFQGEVAEHLWNMMVSINEIPSKTDPKIKQKFGKSVECFKNPNNTYLCKVFFSDHRKGLIAVY